MIPPDTDLPDPEAWSNADDVELLRRIGDADEAALGALYDQWSHALYSLVLSLLGDPDEAEDVVEETFWHAWQNAGSYEPSSGAVSTWLLTMGRRRTLDRLRARDATTSTMVTDLGHDDSHDHLEAAPPARMNPGRSAGIRSRLVMRARAERETWAAPGTGRPDLMRGVASLTGLGHKTTPSAQRAITGETRRVTPAHASEAVPAQTTVPSKALNWYAIAATVALIATAVQLARVSADRREVAVRLAATDTLAPVADSLEAMLRQKEAIVTAISGPDVTVVPLTNRTAQRPLGRMMWNRTANDWVMLTYGLRQPREGMTYQVWLVTDNAHIPVGTFAPDNSGNAIVHIKHDLQREVLRSIAVTEEPEGGVASPTGPMVVAGAA